jgi:thioredoxin-like negative regulator of GroEL
MVLYHAHWCGHCRNFIPKFEEAARSLYGLVHLVKINCANGGENTCSLLKISGKIHPNK